MITDNKMRKMFKKVSLIAFILASLLISFQSHAGFREALSALQHKDAEKMLSEIERAVNSKNYVGASLFLPTLEKKYLQGDFVPSAERKAHEDRFRNSYNGALSKPYKQTWEGLLNNTQKASLIELIGKMELKYVDSNHQVTRLVKYLKGESIDANTSKTDTFQRLNLIQLSVDKGVLDYRLIGDAGTIVNDLFGLNSKPIFVKADKLLGYKFLTLVEVESDGMQYNFPARCAMGDLYLQGFGELKKDYEQAYLWYLRNYLAYDSECGRKEILSMLHHGLIDKFDKGLANKMRGLSENILKPEEFTEIMKPRILSQGKKLIVPVIEINDSSFINYSLKVYENGMVYYRGSGKSAIVGEDRWMIDKSIVEKIVNDIYLLGFESMPIAKNVHPLCGSGFPPSTIMLTVNYQGKEKTVWVREEQYIQPSRRVGNSKLAAMLFVLDKYIPTQQFRCGIDDLTRDYMNCIQADRLTEIEASK